MKIHIVQKGDTLWEISQQYGVDFEQLKDMNSQLSSPDMIMPGMKIKIPGTSKAVKKDNQQAKETQKKEVQKPAVQPPQQEKVQKSQPEQQQPLQQTEQPKQTKPKQQKEKTEQFQHKQPSQHPYKDISVKPFPVLKEDDENEPSNVKPQMPVKPLPEKQQQPLPEFDVNNYISVEFPEMPKAPETKMEKPKKEANMHEMPANKGVDHTQPSMQPSMPMVPMCCYVVHPCQPPMPFPVMGSLPAGFNPEQPVYANFHHQHPMEPMNMESYHPPMGQMHTGFPAPPQGQMMEPLSDGGCGCHGPSSFPPAPPYPQRNEASSQPWMGPEPTPPAGMYPPIPPLQATGFSFPAPPPHPEYKPDHPEAGQKKDDETKE
ncbi:SafA/ExsA family spore coat assembly protein [Virgibacillus xinjiangensis]|uniref:SafA/ExsA family spore coat assembly protein n=1 Tax=Virgibacillus xinjiangensis TaxID=393090 RepID=A0ABV7CSD1_9BACI